MNTWKEKAREKYLDPHSLSAKVGKLRTEGKTIATLNGSFDLLHSGHLHMLYEASKSADVLIVALNTDRSIQEYKSLTRPIIPLNERLSMMAALSFVDYVTWFDETDPRELLEIIQPDVHVNGAEYGEKCIEAETVRKYGGKIAIIPLLPGLSTSSIIAKIQKLDS